MKILEEQEQKVKSKKDISHINCYKCKEQGHYSSNYIKKKMGKDTEPNHCPRMIVAPTKMENEVRVKSHPKISKSTSKCCYKCEGDHLARSCHIKRDWTSLIEIEYGTQELEELLALKTPKKKKNLGDVICFKCKYKGHYADKCPAKVKENCLIRSHKNYISLVTCHKCNDKGHYANCCPKKRKEVSINGTMWSIVSP